MLKSGNTAEATEFSRDIKEWYNGYNIDEHTLYNPWSILNCLSDGVKFNPYWINTSDNKIIKNLISKAKPAVKEVLASLMHGDTIKQPIQENLVFQYLDKSEEAVWALLLYSGYLNAVSKEREGRRLVASLVIPNKEVMAMYDEIVESWFRDALSLTEYDRFISSLARIFHHNLNYKKYYIDNILISYNY